VLGLYVNGVLAGNASRFRVVEHLRDQVVIPGRRKTDTKRTISS
jgi:hypothetical protein